MSKPSEGPILMNGEMVRATLDGRKTQTRRLDGLHRINEAPDDWEFIRWQEYPDGSTRAVFEHRSGESGGVKCKYRNVTRLWVRETFWLRNHGNTFRGTGIDYKAGGNKHLSTIPKGRGKLCCWRHSIHMPRWASRITLEITDVRVERVRDISEEDAIAEGAQCAGVPASLTNRGGFAKLWEIINGKRPGCSWAESPWVWCISFRRAAP